MTIYTTTVEEGPKDPPNDGFGALNSRLVVHMDPLWDYTMTIPEM